MSKTKKFKAKAKKARLTFKEKRKTKQKAQLKCRLEGSPLQWSKTRKIRANGSQASFERRSVSNNRRRIIRAFDKAEKDKRKGKLKNVRLLEDKKRCRKNRWAVYVR